MLKRLFILLLVYGIFTGCQDSPTNPGASTGELDLLELTIGELQAGYDSGAFTVTDVVRGYLERIALLDDAGPELGAIIEVNPDAMAIAEQLDAELAEGQERGPMHGVPVILKDNIDTRDSMSTTAGARPMAGSKPLQDSWVAQKLREGGAVILGKANLSEWANFHSSFSSSGWSALGGQTRNPYDITRNPCGSSSGSAVAVAANLCMVAIGTETNGSIVCPSNHNGIVGIKPTVGLISRAGIIPISFTQDTPGPMARTVRDAAICLGDLTGVDSTDAKTLLSVDHYHTDYTQFLNAGGLAGKRIGVYTRPLGNRAKVDTIFRQAVAFMETQGAETVEIDQISEENIGGPSFQVLLYEFKDGLNKYFESLGPKAKVKSLDELIEKTLADSVEMQYFDHELLKMANEKGGLDDPEYQEALNFIETHAREKGIDRVMKEHNLDVIVAPTRGPAWKTDLINGDNTGDGISSSSPAAIAGYPSVTVPMGNIDGLPLNISFFGRAWSEPLILEVAYAYEQGTQHRIVPEFKGWKQ